jgi:anthranilate phosphoribosyltransferase
LLSGKGSQAETDITILNAAALLQTAGKAKSLIDAAAMAREALLSARAGKVLDAYIEASRD